MTTARGGLWVVDEPGQGGHDPAGAGERLRRRQVHQGPGGGELERGAGRRQGLDQRMRPAVAGERGRSVTWPRALAAAAARSSLPSAMAVRRTSVRTSGPAAMAAAKVAWSLAGNA